MLNSGKIILKNGFCLFESAAELPATAWSFWSCVCCVFSRHETRVRNWSIYDDFGGVNISFPPISDKTNDRISLKGPKECIEAVKQKILDIISDYEAQVSVEVEIEPVHHRVLLGPRGKVNHIQNEHDVRIKLIGLDSNICLTMFTIKCELQVFHNKISDFEIFVQTNFL